MEVHRQVMPFGSVRKRRAVPRQARRNDEDVQLRQQQDEEYAEGLARDQERARERRPDVVEAPPLDEAHLTLASEFLRGAPREGRERDPVRLVLPLGGGTWRFGAQEVAQRRPRGADLRGH